MSNKTVHKHKSPILYGVIHYTDYKLVAEIVRKVRLEQVHVCKIASIQIAGGYSVILKQSVAVSCDAFAKCFIVNFDIAQACILAAAQFKGYDAASAKRKRTAFKRARSGFRTCPTVEEVFSVLVERQALVPPYSIA